MKNIIIIDMQKGFIKESNKHLIEKINSYLSKNKFDNIYLTKCINDNDSPYQKILKWNGMTNFDDQQLVINYPNNAKIITKNCYGISYKDIKMFKKLGITEIEICGTDTDACVYAIAFNLFDNGIKPIILSDLCASSSRNQNIHNNAIELLKRQFGNENIK